MTTYAAVNVVTDKAKLGHLIESIGRRGRKLDNDTHRAIVSIVHHFIEHGDCTMMDRLLDAMSKGSRPNAVRQWLDTYSLTVQDEGTKRRKADKANEKWGDKDYQRKLLEQGAMRPFYQGRSVEGVPYSVITDIEGVIKFLDKHREKAEKESAKDYAKTLEAVRNTVDKFKAKVA